MSPRPLVGPRLQRVLTIVPWVLAHPGITVTELAERFEVPAPELERDLALLPLCGLPPYTADRLIDVSVIDGEVEIRLAEYFERPLRLSPAEGLALLAAGRALLSVPGSDTAGPLATALDKLEHALGAKGRLAIDVGPPGHMERLQQAVADHEQLEIDYFSFARDEITTRVIDPWRVFHAFGAWYVAAWCHRAGAERLFRADRVRAVRGTGNHFDPVAGAGAADGPEVDGGEVESGEIVYRPRADDPRVTLRLAPAARWVVESYPHESVNERRDGSFDVVLAVSEPAWLDRLLLTLGPSAAVVGPPAAADTAAAAAARVLARYVA